MMYGQAFSLSPYLIAFDASLTRGLTARIHSPSGLVTSRWLMSAYTAEPIHRGGQGSDLAYLCKIYLYEWFNVI